MIAASTHLISLYVTLFTTRSSHFVVALSTGITMAIAPSLSFGAKRASAQSFLQSHRGVVRTASTAAPRTDLFVLSRL